MATNEVLDALRHGLVTYPSRSCCPRDEAHAQCNAVPMSQLVRFERFDSMARAMAEVEELPQARFALIRYDHIALDLDVACDNRGNKAEILRKELLGERCRSRRKAAQL